VAARVQGHSLNRRLLEILACPECAGDLVLSAERESGGEVERGRLTCAGCRRTYPVVRHVPRFVPAENYASNFGFQWNRFRQTQLDSHTGVPISRERLLFSTEWRADEVNGKRVLDVGCGAGRFAEVTLALGADLVALDYSAAVDACWDNLGPHPRLDVVQGDTYKLPFKPGAFDFVYCLGVLQHTPDVKQAFLCLPPQVRPGGKLAVDVYPKLALNMLWPKYWLRPLTRRMNARTLFRLVERLVPILLPISDALATVPAIGRKLRWMVPVANHRLDYPRLSRSQVYEWAVLNTYDMFAPTYDFPQDAPTLEAWFREAGMRDTRVYRRGHLIGHASR
jgi:SAM-dependent methyltransferase